MSDVIQYLFKDINLLMFSIITLMIMVNGCSENKVSADKVFINTKVITLDKNIPSAEAFAVNGDKIAAIGTREEIEKYIGDSTEVIDLKGNYSYPGFNDSHAHFLGIGQSMIELDLMSANNWDEIVYMVSEAVDHAMPGAWIIGRGWHQEKWTTPPVETVEGYPTNDILSQATPMNPVMLTHASGHAIIANKKAMELAGITSETENPEGGRIVRNEKGEAIGVFEENAEKLIRSVYDEQQKQRTPEDIQNEKIREAKLAVQECLSNGITSLTDAGSDFATIDFFKEMIDQNILKIRLNVMVQEDNNELRDNLDKYKITGYGNDHLRVGSIKKYMDGALGSRGAWMFEPYSDLPDHTGEAVTPLDEMRETARIAAQKGFQLCTHAIGDRANHEVLNIYDRIFKTTPDTIDYRWRIEHAQHLSPSDIPRFGELGVIAAMQGIHCTSDAPFVIERIGEERAEQEAYAWRKLIDAGATICNGTDSPIEKVNPIACYYASVTRQLNDGTYFFPEEKMTREEALKSYTINGAYASFEENKKGTLSVGKLADVTVLDTDLLSASDEEIKNAKVIFTIIGGEVLYKFSNVDPDGENAN